MLCSHRYKAFSILFHIFSAPQFKLECRKSGRGHLFLFSILNLLNWDRAVQSSLLFNEISFYAYVK